ncbi:splicing factor 3a, subunit 1 [Chytridiales sp. JEL 0842]|nr:splicing factor 3a, subunit 1 [Chytridiales sp. JEL 0842]
MDVDGTDKTQPPEGMIYPPPEIRKIVDKTAVFVARNGSQFEERIREKEQNDPKFCFLNPNDPYHVYYAFRLAEARAGKDVETKTEQKEKVEEAKPTKEDGKHIPKEPQAYEFSATLPHISASDLDVIKLTAQFAARNGRQFLTALAQREQRNYQFDFLKPNHSLYRYFNALVSQYSKILQPSKQLIASLKACTANKYGVLERIGQRVEYETYQSEMKRKAEEEADKERIAYASIDWHDFVVVDTIEFLESDEMLRLPPPISIMDLESMTLAQKRAATVYESTAATEDNNVDMEMDVDDDMDEGSDDEEPKPKPASKPAPTTLPPRPPAPMPLPRMPAPMPSIPSALRPPPTVLPPPPRVPGLPPALPPQPPSQPPQTRAAEDDDGPDMKRQKISDDSESSLIPESSFLAQHPHPVRVTVQQSEGPAVHIDNVEMTMTVSALKERIAALTGIPGSKQKLTLPSGLPLKNTATAAYYNLTNNIVLTLGARERGGRKQ